MKYELNPVKIEKNEWQKFVYDHPKGNIFQTPQMFYSYTCAKNYEPIFIACTSGEGEIIGLLVGSVFSEKSGILKKLISRSIVFGGPLLTPKVNTVEFLTQYDKIVREKAVYSRIINLFDNSNEYIGIESVGYKLNDHLNYNIDLTKGLEKIWNDIHNTRRRQVKRGFRRGITVEIGKEVKDLRPYYDILKNTYTNAGLPLQDFSFFENIYNNLTASGNIIFFSAFDKEKLIGHRIILSYKNTLYDWFAGDLPEARDKYTNDVLVWEVLKWGSENGFKRFDFGGAGEPGKEYGVRDFKKKFGGDLVAFGNYFKIHQPVKYVLLQNLLKVYRKIR